MMGEDNRVVLSLMLSWLSFRSCHVYDTTTTITITITITTTTTITITQSIFRHHYMYHRWFVGVAMEQSSFASVVVATRHNDIKYEGRE